MKKVLMVVTLLIFAGCTHTNDPLLDASLELHKSAHKELMEKYIPNDTSLDEAGKQVRLDALKSYGELLKALQEKRGK